MIVLEDILLSQPKIQVNTVMLAMILLMIVVNHVYQMHGAQTVVLIIFRFLEKNKIASLKLRVMNQLAVSK